MNIRKNRVSIVFLAAMLLFSNIAGAVNLCLMDKAPAPHAPVVVSEDPCCDTADEQTVPPDDCCAVLAEHRSEAPPVAGLYVPPAVAPVATVVARVTAWGDQHPAAAPPALRIAGPPLNLLFKNFRI